jgi:hypothetical protein
MRKELPDGCPVFDRPFGLRRLRFLSRGIVVHREAGGRAGRQAARHRRQELRLEPEDDAQAAGCLGRGAGPDYGVS